MSVGRVALVAGLAASALAFAACDGEMEGTATFFEKVAVPVQQLKDDLKIDRVVVAGHASTTACPGDRAKFREAFEGAVAEVLANGRYATPAFTFPDQFTHVDPASCGTVDTMDIGRDGVTQFGVLARLPITESNCKAFCAGQCKATKKCSSECVPGCMQSRAIIGHNVTASFDADMSVKVSANLVFDRLQ